MKSRFSFYNSGCIRTPKNFKSSNEDEDVAVERERIYSDRNNTNNDVLRMVDLVKVKKKIRKKKRIFQKFLSDRFMDQHLEKNF